MHSKSQTGSGQAGAVLALLPKMCRRVICPGLRVGQVWRSFRSEVATVVALDYEVKGRTFSGSVADTLGESPMRLLYCRTCATIPGRLPPLTEIPDLGYELPEGQPDPLVQHVIEEHTRMDPLGHGGSQMRDSPFRLMQVSDEEWNDDKEGVIKVLNAENKKVGFDAWVYESVNTYAEDALRCYRDHHRPAEGCIDWWDESKRIGRPTEEGRSAVADQYKLGERDPHLCQYCPVASWVQTQVNFRQGLYKK